MDSGYEFPTCPDCEFTEQCTDKCRVVSCDDPEHDTLLRQNALRNNQPAQNPNPEWDIYGSTCPWGGPLHCPNFDRFVRTEFFPELRSGNSPASKCLTLPYDPNAPILLPSAADLKRPHSPCAHDPSSSVSPSTAGHDLLFCTSPDTSAPGSIQNSPPLDMHSMSDMTFSSAFPTQKPVKCLWNQCTSSFDSMSDLITHVNMHHLSPTHQHTHQPNPSLSQAPIPSKPSTADENLHLFDVSNPSDAHGPMGSCLWKDCNGPSFGVPAPLQQANPSNNGHRPQVPMEYLLTHLLQDHLGLPVKTVPDNHNHINTTPLPNATTTTTPQNHSAPISWSNQQPPPPPSSSTTHMHPSSSNTQPICQWQNCGMTFPTIEDLNNHINEKHVGSGRAHYECLWNGCDRSGERGFSSKQKVCRHIQTHTGHKPFHCEICKQSFSEAATLQQHMRRHTRERPCVCDFPGCNKTFSTTGALTIHKRVHNGHKPFKCTYCEKAFSESSNLAKHLRTHTGEKPYHCPEPNCGKAFARPDQLNRHLGVHNKKKC